MNPKQKKIIRLGIILIALMGVFPPWTQTYSHVQVGYSKVPAGYAFIGKPPPVVSQPGSGSVNFGMEIDLRRLLVEWLVVGLVTAALVCTAQDPKK